MGMNIAQKILWTHLAEGKLIPGTQIGLRIDHVISRDSAEDKRVQPEHYGVPGHTLLTSGGHEAVGGVGMLVICATAMEDKICRITMPKVVKIELIGRIGVSVRIEDVMAEIRRRLSIRESDVCILEYAGEGVAVLSVSERAAIASVSAELGCTTSIFPSDAVTRAFLIGQGRAGDYMELRADPDAEYDEEITVNLDNFTATDNL